MASVYRVDNTITVYDGYGERHLISILFRYRNGNGPRIIRVDDKICSTAENSEEANEVVADMIKTRKYSFAKPF